MTMGIFLPGERGYGYKNSVFHRIVPGYIVQGKVIYTRLNEKTHPEGHNIYIHTAGKERL